MRKNSCNSCGMPIIWATTLKGNLMPLDWEADQEKGTLVLLHRSHEGTPLAIGLNSLNETAREAAAKHEVELRVSHFATCPNADRHRKKKVGRPRS